MDFFFDLIIICVTISSIRSEDDCKSIIPDAINRQKNDTIVIFQDKQVWFLDLQDKAVPNVLTGPCLIKTVLPQMDGPIDAGVTFENHGSITEYIGASIYFSKGKFFTFKNLKPYSVEYGGLDHMPFTGSQASISSEADEKAGNKIMKTQMSAAFYDINTNMIKLIFTSGKVLAYNFEMSPTFDIPDITDVETELKRFGGQPKPLNITAALTLKKEKQVLFFEGSTYYPINSDLSDKANTAQSFEPHPISDFLRCANIVRKKCEISDPIEPNVSDVSNSTALSNDTTVEVPNVVSGETVAPIAENGTIEAKPADSQESTATSRLSTFFTLYQLIVNLIFLSSIQMLL